MVLPTYYGHVCFHPSFYLYMSFYVSIALHNNFDGTSTCMTSHIGLSKVGLILRPDCVLEICTLEALIGSISRQ